LSLRQSFQLLCDSQSHPGGRLSLPRRYPLAKKTGRRRNVTDARGPTVHESALNAPVRPRTDIRPERLNVANRRSPDVADRGRGRRSWADSGSTRVASGRTGVRGKAPIKWRTRNTLPDLGPALGRPLRCLRNAARSPRRRRTIHQALPGSADARLPTSAVGLDLTASRMKRVSARERKRLHRAASLARSASHTARCIGFGNASALSGGTQSGAPALIIDATSWSLSRARR
jgi:hypothetical protein